MKLKGYDCADLARDMADSFCAAVVAAAEW